MVAAATVALLVIYETGLLIPLGLIGLATGGILK
jgi:cytochrome c biogenesis protein CcdA